ncbi:nuclear factor of activated T-cells, cytoplasmic 1 isoform X1 [Conger conger]|uniref:nuclear factor of activated T-cells, cytoplasmic 1 isoform X1 n=2 Tax=Conger conger TaxID=82655 RepID=UPI002A5AC7C5|nr:nuclear factor of activated T-cells, cytoplasmic 1 isoform X1 [Conger conger]
MQNSCLQVFSKFNFGSLVPSAGGNETGLHLIAPLATNMKSAEEDAFSYTPNVTLSLPISMGNPCLSTQYHNLQSSSIIPMSSCHQDSYALHNNGGAPGYYLTPNLRPNGAPALESPRIEITAYGQFPEDEMEESALPMVKRVNSIVTLTLPNADGYRDPSCLSPASSLSSRSCNSEASSYESGFSYNYDNSPQNSPWQSPCVSPKGSSSLHSCTHAGSPRHSPSGSPRTSVADESWPAPPRGSRPGSPCNGKRKYSFNGAPTCRHPSYSPGNSPTVSPQGSPRVSVPDEAWLANTNQYTNSAIVAAINALTTDGMADLSDSVPLKSRKTSLEHSPAMSLKVEPGQEEPGPGEVGQDDYPAHRMPFKKENYCGGFLDVPQHPYPWSKPKPYISPSLPALDWQLPSCSGPYSLQIEVQPKSHHRAHYETEGSRGAVKALSGGHPVVQLYGYMESEPLTLQLFIGTADDRLLRPHAFYQVHRITGKTVSTASHEVMQSNTKVLEIPLLPENNMRAIIDCAGILKLRNSDIELRKGETDIGRKNTRVRMVFRVHINQPNGRTVSLQAASNPIECSQRSAQELPLVEKQSADSSPATGGKTLVLSGHNFLPDSKVVFVEKAQDGHHLWETEAKVDKDSFKSTTLLVEIPPYRNQRISSPVQVNFYVCNGKRKRSQYQRFTYLSPNIPIIKTEPNDDYEPQGAPRLTMRSKAYYGQLGVTPAMPADPGHCLVGGYPSSSPSSSPKLHDLSPAAYPKCLSGGQSHHAVPGIPAIQEAPSRPMGVHPGSPDHAPLAMLQPQVASHLSSPGTGDCSHGYRPPALFPNGSPASSPVSPETPFSPAYSPPQAPPAGSPHLTPVAARSSPPTLLREDSSPPTLAVTVKQEPQELDQMYLDDVNEIIRNDLSSISVHSHA